MSGTGTRRHAELAWLLVALLLRGVTLWLPMPPGMWLARRALR